MKRTLSIACLGGLILSFVCTASAHHSFAMFDRSKKITTIATITQFQWTNPHSWLEIDVPDAKGGTTHWSIECNSPNNLSRQGWHSNSVKPGDKVTIQFWPLRNGDKGGLFIALTFPNGQVLDEAAFRSAEKQP